MFDTGTDDADTVNISIESYAGFQFKFKLRKDDTVCYIKHQIEELHGLDVAQQNLLFLDRILDDETTLEQENIQNGATLKLALNLCSGRAVHMQGIKYRDYFCADVTSFFDGGYLDGKMLLLAVHWGIPTLYSSYEENGQRQIVSLFTGAEPNAESWSRYLLHVACLANRFEVDEGIEELVGWCTRNMERNLMIKRRECYMQNIHDVCEDDCISPDFNETRCDLEKWIFKDQSQVEDSHLGSNSSDAKTMYQCAKLPSENVAHSRLPPLSSSPTVSSPRRINVHHIDDRPKTMPQTKCLLSPCDFPAILSSEQLITGDSVMADKKANPRPILLNILPDVDEVSHPQWSTKEWNSTSDVRLPLINNDSVKSTNFKENVKPVTNAKDWSCVNHDDRISQVDYCSDIVPMKGAGSRIEFPEIISRKRCFACNKKIKTGLAMTCRCGEIFCLKHRYPELHSCTFDYKSDGERLLKKVCPLIVPKLPKI